MYICIMQLGNLMGLIAGGAIGSVLRWAIGLRIPFHAHQFSWSTFFINASACFLIGLLWSKIETYAAKLFWITGFLGGFSTFSGFTLEIIQYLQCQEYKLAAVYGISSIIFGILLTWLGQRFSVSFSA